MDDVDDRALRRLDLVAVMYAAMAVGSALGLGNFLARGLVPDDRDGADDAAALDVLVSEGAARQRYQGNSGRGRSEKEAASACIVHSEPPFAGQGQFPCSIGGRCAVVLEPCPRGGFIGCSAQSRGL